ncbi:uncharacterized protein Dvir_GJ16716 [Drosophila virilis]|uniref:DUF4794 domain-containing protein n=1 Tax=Drosophila virilis TaxID=7244 RepID=B4M811_DROVI|nr:uncharacterized protein Dvir_GJ16716 [Drosophila virilis]
MLGLKCSSQCLALSCILLVSCFGWVTAQQFVLPGRSQRSLFGPPPPGPWSSSGWSSSPSFELPTHHEHNHITRDEVLALLAAWKAADAKPPAKPEPEAEPEPEPEPEAPEPEPEPEEPAPEPAPGPQPAVPLTVSLPAFVPIQLSAMYTAPAPVPGAGLGAFGFGGGFGGAGGAGGGAGAQAQAHSGRRNVARANGNIRFPVANPRSFASANYVAPRPRFYRTIVAETGQPMSIGALPPPPFLANPVKFVPSNWQ